MTLWFRAIWWVVTQKNGASAKGLSRVLKISYKVTWALLHKIRRAMINIGRSRRSGIVEVDECYIGGKEEGVIGRGSIKKSLVLVAVEVSPPKVGRIRMSLIEDASAATLNQFVQEFIEPGSIVQTDGWSGYSDISKLGYIHKKNPTSIVNDVMPHVHLVISLVKMDNRNSSRRNQQVLSGLLS